MLVSRCCRLALLGSLLTLGLTAARAVELKPNTPLVLDLSQPFATRAPWRFTAMQGPDAPDPVGDTGDTVPGPIRLCLSRDGGQTCRPDLGDLLRPPAGPDAALDPDDLFVTPHYLNDARVVQPRPGRALLLLQVSSTHSGNGDQRVATTALGFDAGRAAFVPVYRQQTGRNNNQEIRYLDAGPLRGDIVYAAPTFDAPFGFWIAVSAPGRGPADPYRPVLRYRSHTRYNDGNPLAVIDSEMPEIQRRLGAWRAGQPLPVPAGRPCAKPHLVDGALWC